MKKREKDRVDASIDNVRERERERERERGHRLWARMRKCLYNLH